MLASIATRAAARGPRLELARRHGGPLQLARALASSSSSSPEPPPSPSPPSPPPKPETAEEATSAAASAAAAAKEVHPALVSLLNSGFIESRRRLREELAEDAWRGEPVGKGGGGGNDGHDGHGILPLPHTSPPSWAARRGISRFELFVSGAGSPGGDGGSAPPPFPDGDERAARQLERIIAGLYAALDVPEASGGDSTSATLRSLERAVQALPTARHRLLARAFVADSLAEALKDEYKRAADESRGMADLWGTAGGEGSGGAAAAAGGVVWRGIKRLLPWGWVGWLMPGGGGGGKKKGNGGGGGGKG